MEDVHLIGPSRTDEGDYVRVSAEIRVGASRRDLWYRSSTTAVSDLLDPFVAACLVPAMKRNRPMYLHGPASAEFLGQVRLIQRVFELYREDPFHEERHRLRPIAVVPDELRSPTVGHGSATFFSAGVDSLYTALTRSEDLDTGLFIDDFDAPFPAAVREQVFENAAAAAGDLGLDLVRIQTNAKELTMAGLGPDGLASSWRMVGGSVQEGVTLLHAPTLGRVVFPSSEAVGHHTRFGDGPTLDPLYSAGGQQVEHDDILVNRFEKTQRIADHPVARAHLRVCWQPLLNCGRCPKCVRTMLALEALGVRELFVTFPSCPTDDLVERVIDVGRRNPGSTWRYFDEVDAFLEDAGERPELRRAVAASKVVDRPISREEALVALTPTRVRRAVRRLRQGRRVARPQ